MVARRLICFLILMWCLPWTGTTFSYGQNRPVSTTDSLHIEQWFAQWQRFRSIQPDSSAAYAQRIFDWGQRHKQPLIRARGLAYLASEARDRSDFSRSVSLFQQALLTFESLKATELIAYAYQGLALTYKRMGDAQSMNEFTRQGLQYAQRALVLFQKVGDIASTANTLNTIGIIKRDLNAYEEARQAYQTGISLLEKAKINNATLAILYGNMGQLAIEPDNQYDKAIQYIGRSLQLNLAANRRTNIEHNHRNLSNAYRLMKDYGRAIEHGEEALQISGKLRDPHRLFNTLGVVYKAYRDAGDYKKALTYLEKYKEIEDSLGRADKARQIASLQAEFDNKRASQLAKIEADKEEQLSAMALQHARLLAHVEADRDRDLLRMKNQTELAKTQSLAEANARFADRQKEESIRQLRTKTQLQERQLIGLGFGAGLFFLLSGLLLWQYQRIEQTQAKVSQQASQLRLLMRELHHRVKNNLAIVSGLLELQSNRLADDNAKRAFREGQQRVQAMSLLHQRLYQTDALTTIDMGEYIASLIESLMGAYGYTHQTVQTNVQVSKQEVDVDLAIPIGLILNELLTNTFKYALPYTTEPRLSVDLQRQGDSLLMRVADNGPGLDLVRWERPGGSFGKRLIAGLSDQIGGSVSVDNQDGTQFFIRVPVSDPVIARAA